jgi:glycosyltransferase involved in cell wall biosynthesis
MRSGSLPDQWAESSRSEWLSFVIPTREEAAYIGRTLKHLSAARDRDSLDIRLIVVDGGSLDGTTKHTHLADVVIEDCPLAAETIGNARNLGAAASESELIFHTDADVIIPNLAAFLRRIKIIFEDPRLVVATAPVVPYPWNARPLDRLMHAMINLAVRGAIPFGAFLALGECQIVRRSAFEAIGGYDGGIVLGEDRDLLQRLAKCGRVAYLGDFQVFHSARRYRKIGYKRVLFDYTREGWALLTGQPSPIKEWTPVR